MTPRIVSGLLFFAASLTLVYGLHHYLWVRLVRDAALPVWAHRSATGALIVLGVSMPLTFAVTRLLPRGWAALVAWPAYVWMGLMFFLFVATLGAELARALWALARPEGVADPERRLLLGRFLGGAAASLAGGLSIFSMREALGPVAVKQVEVPLERLPRALDGFTIAQLTDVHVGPTIGRAFIEDLVARTNALAADLIVITGDLVDGSVEALREHVAPLGRLAARHGVYFVTGNHEYYSGADEWIAELRRLGVRVLRNERVAILDGAHGFDLAGIDDHSSRGFAPGHGPDLARALEGRDPTQALVLLAHQPRAIKDAVRHGVDLQLSGHTHGGQIWPWRYLVYLQQPYVSGLQREGYTRLYVSRGTGYWGPPMRLGAPAEITRITMRAAG